MTDPVLPQSPTLADEMAFLNAVNSAANEMPYVAVASDDNNDVWTDVQAPGRSWECRDYTIYKGKLMRAGGWQLPNMFVVLCLIEPPTRELHAVQGARLSDGSIWILDNRVIYPASRIYRWDEPVYDYVWVHQQISGSLNWRDARNGLI